MQRWAGIQFAVALPTIPVFAVERAWVPNPTWRRFIVETLKAHRIAYEPL
jgi:hypothetical protein